MNWFNLSDNVNLLSIIGAIVIVLTVFIVAGNAFNQMKKAKSNAELSEHTWDGIGEYKNPLPLGWALMFVLLILFALWYFLIGYPLNKYSSIGEYNESVQEFNAKYDAKYSSLDDDKKIQMGERLFTLHCAPCHGLTGDGINGKAQDLTVWGSVDGILNTLEHGSTGLGYGEMPAGLVEGEDAKLIAEFIVKGNEKGKELFAENCASCHGDNAEGIEDVAPALNVYGKAEFIANVLRSGKDAPSDASVKVIGRMPSFIHALSANQIDALSRYVSTLSKE